MSVSSEETYIITDPYIPIVNTHSRFQLRRLTDLDWCKEHGSGTLNKSIKNGAAWRSHYLHERVKYEFGAEFDILPRSRVMAGDVNSEPDEPGVTEANWYFERYVNFNIFEGDTFYFKYLHVTPNHGKPKEGIGILCGSTSAVWVPTGHVVFAIISQFDTDKKIFLEARNPC